MRELRITSTILLFLLFDNVLASININYFVIHFVQLWMKRTTILLLICFHVSSIFFSFIDYFSYIIQVSSNWFIRSTSDHFRDFINLWLMRAFLHHLTLNSTFKGFGFLPSIYLCLITFFLLFISSLFDIILNHN